MINKCVVTNYSTSYKTEQKKKASFHFHEDQEVFCKKDVLRNFTNFTGKHLGQSLSFFNKVAGLRPATLLKK